MLDPFYIPPTKQSQGSSRLHNLSVTVITIKVFFFFFFCICWLLVILLLLLCQTRMKSCLSATGLAINYCYDFIAQCQPVPTSLLERLLL